jgi:Lrp/AsnC family leucine-responsive transcriptional regulator
MAKRLAPPSPPAALDDTDRSLLAALAEDARQPVSEPARLVGLSAPSTAERLRRLETQGVIERFTVQIDPRALGYTLQAIVRVKPLPEQPRTYCSTASKKASISVTRSSGASSGM